MADRGRECPTVNFKYTLDWCVFGLSQDPANTITPANEQCSQVCAGPNNSAKIALTNRYLETNQALQYLYCDGPDIENILDNCSVCLDKVPNAKSLSHCKSRETIPGVY